MYNLVHARWNIIMLFLFFGSASTQISFSEITSDPDVSVAYGYNVTYFSMATYTTNLDITSYWRYNGVNVAEVSYQPFTEPVIGPVNERFSLRVNGNNYTLEMWLDIINTTLDDDGLLLCVNLGSDCSLAVKSVVSVQECSIKTDESFSVEVSQKPCGLDCFGTFTCMDGLRGETVTAECLRNAKWSSGITCLDQCSGNVGAEWNCPGCESCAENHTDVIEGIYSFDCNQENCQGSGVAVCTNNGWKTETVCTDLSVEIGTTVNYEGYHIFSDGGVAGIVIGCLAAGSLIGGGIIMLVKSCP